MMMSSWRHHTVLIAYIEKNAYMEKNNNQLDIMKR